MKGKEQHPPQHLSCSSYWKAILVALDYSRQLIYIYIYIYIYVYIYIYMYIYIYHGSVYDPGFHALHIRQTTWKVF